MDSRDLAVFEEVVRNGSFTAAGQALHTVQSNVTARIKALEAELGVQLLDRHSRGVVPTRAGTALLPYASEVRRLIGEAQAVLKGGGDPSGILTIGSLETTTARRLPPVLASYASKYPDVDISLRTATTAELISWVLDRTIEGALVAGPVHHPLLEEEVLLEEELILVRARFRESALALSMSNDIRILVLKAGCSYRERLENVLARRGLGRIRTLEFGTIDAILGCAAAGVGITLLPRSVVERHPLFGDLSIEELPGTEAAVETVFVRRRDHFTPPALARFIEECRALAGHDHPTR